MALVFLIWLALAVVAVVAATIATRLLLEGLRRLHRPDRRRVRQDTMAEPTTTADAGDYAS
ncbi:MAG: hypothetical protein M3394_01035 [Actinomycetota bacterium]|nr:hypothetical protein [Actinomycetota bacterium]